MEALAGAGLASEAFLEGSIFIIKNNYEYLSQY